MAENKYIDDVGVVADDAHNDINVINTIKNQILQGVKVTQDLQEQKAMAKYGHILEETVDSLDDILHKILNPIEDKAEEGKNYYEYND
jgi:hypothetical protein